MTEYLLDMESEILYPGMTYNSLQASEKAKVAKPTRDKYLAMLSHEEWEAYSSTSK